MKMRIGPLLGVGIGWLIGSGRASELIDKAKSNMQGGSGGARSMFGSAKKSPTGTMTGGATGMGTTTPAGGRSAAPMGSTVGSNTGSSMGTTPPIGG